VEREGAEWVVREGGGPVGRNEPILYAHMNNKRKMKKKKELVQKTCSLNKWDFFA
jgi:hypothetical protein